MLIFNLWLCNTAHWTALHGTIECECVANAVCLLSVENLLVLFSCDWIGKQRLCLVYNYVLIWSDVKHDGRMSSENDSNAKPCINRKLLIFKLIQHRIVFRTRKVFDVYFAVFMEKILLVIFFLGNLCFLHCESFHFLRIDFLFQVLEKYYIKSLQIFATHKKHKISQKFSKRFYVHLYQLLTTESNFVGWMDALFFHSTCDCFIKKSFSNYSTENAAKNSVEK